MSLSEGLSKMIVARQAESAVAAKTRMPIRGQSLPRVANALFAELASAFERREDSRVTCRFEEDHCAIRIADSESIIEWDVVTAVDGDFDSNEELIKLTEKNFINRGEWTLWFAESAPLIAYLQRRIAVHLSHLRDLDLSEQLGRSAAG